MVYEGKEFNTMGEVFNEALHYAKTDKNKAISFFKAYVEHIFNNNKEINTYAEAEKIAKSNFGYFAGYYDAETCDIIYNTYQCSHPIFGDKPYDVSPEEAFKKGMEIGKNLKR